MTLATMIYGLIVAVLVAGAAWFLDRGLRALGRPTRWVWLGALGLGALAPFLPRFLPPAASENSPGTFALPVRVLYELGTPAPSLPEPTGGFLGGIGVENSVSVLWVGGSVLVVILFALIGLRLRRLRATWEAREVCGEEVLRSDRFGPAVVGLIRSRIVLPSWSFGLGQKELEMVVLHEREHVRARDPALLATGAPARFALPMEPCGLVVPRQTPARRRRRLRSPRSGPGHLGRKLRPSAPGRRRRVPADARSGAGPDPGRTLSH